MMFSDRQLLVIGGVALVGGYLVYRKAEETVGGVVKAFNPQNHDNVPNRLFTSGYQWLTGSKGTLGTDLADFVENPRLFDDPKPAPAPVPRRGASGGW